MNGVGYRQKGYCRLFKIMVCHFCAKLCGHLRVQTTHIYRESAEMTRKKESLNSEESVESSSGANAGSAEQSVSPGRCPDSCPKKSGVNLLQPCRVFISYSHEDKDKAEKLEKHLFSEGLFPIRDSGIQVGEAFSDEIKEMIERSHVFMPLVTPKSITSPWVQQEIGYAEALHVPVFPINVNNEPAAMNEQIHRVEISTDSWECTDKLEEEFNERLKYEVVHDLVKRACKRKKHGRYDCATYWIERQELLARLIETASKEGCILKEKAQENVKSMGKSFDERVWRLRQRSRFSSFSIPDANPNSNAWKLRNQGRFRSYEERELLRRERKAIEAYMECFGFDLIVDIGPEEHGSSVRGHAAVETLMRLRLLVSFLVSSLDKDSIRVVMPRDKVTTHVNLFIVGDWFAAEAVVPHGSGVSYERTMFTRHAPTVLNMIVAFDQDFIDCLPGPICDPKTIRRAKEHVLVKVNEYMKEVEENCPDEDMKELEDTSKELGLRQIEMDVCV